MGGFSEGFSGSFNFLEGGESFGSSSFSGSFSGGQSGADPEPQPEQEHEYSGGGGRTLRKRYLLPNDVLVLATPTEIQEILEEFVEVEQPKPKTKKQKRKAKHEPFVPVEIHFEPLPDFSVQTFRPVIPETWTPDWKDIYKAVEALKRRIDDEEAILLLL